MADFVGRAFVLSVRSGLGFVHEMMTGISDALAHHGWRSEMLDVSSLQGIASTFDRLIETREQGPALIVDYLGHHRIHTMKAFRHHDVFVFFSDAPYAYYDNLASIGADAVLGYSDRAHTQFHDDHKMPFKRSFFPHAGPELNPAPKPLTERDIPFLFIANLMRSPRLDGLDKARRHPDARRLTDAIVKRVLDGNEEPYIAYKGARAELGIDPGLPPNQGALYLADIAGWIEAKRRHDVLVALRDRPVHVAGKIAGNFFDTPMPKLVVLGEKSTKDCIVLMDRARTVINTIAVRPTGSHERMWHALAQGAALWTDPSALVAEDFPVGSVFTLPLGAGDLAKMADEIAVDAGLADRIATARSAYTAKHTWRVRVRGLLGEQKFAKATA